MDGGKVSFTRRANMGLVVVLSYNVGTVRRVRCTGDLNVSFVVYSRRIPSSVVPPTITVLGPGHPSSPFPFGRLYNYNMKFGFVRTFTGGGGVPFSHLVPLLSFYTIDVTTSVIPMISRGQVLTFRKLGLLGAGPDVKLGTVVSVYKLGKERLSVDSVIFGLKPHVGTSKHVRGNGRDMSLLMRQSFNRTLGVTGRVGRCGRRHGSVSGRVARRTGLVISQLRARGRGSDVMLCSRN